jgi:ribosomal protein S18 acetylase RimI-like enzyme
MNITRIDLKTDLIFTRYEGEVRDRGTYQAVHTPENPTFHWGNFLIFEKAPGPGDAAEWNRTFLKEFGHYPTLIHRAYTWNSGRIAPGIVAKFAELRVKLELNRVLSLTSEASLLRPKKFDTSVDVREIQSEAEWEAVIENQIDTRAADFTREHYEPFKRRQFARYRRMHAAGLGSWFGAYSDGRLVADLGLYYEDGIGRFQSVGTHPDFRRRGICGRLVYEASTHGFMKWNLGTLVMVAADDYHAAGIYESVGFGVAAITEQLYCPRS